MGVRAALLSSLLVAISVQSGALDAEMIPVRYQEGSVHGYLALRTMEGKIVAAGDLTQTVRGGRVVSRLVYHFRDGSIDDDTAIFTQDGHFRLLSDHRIQRGPTFPEQLDVRIDAVSGQVTVRSREKGEKGKEKVETSHMDLPPDLSNGILFDALKNLSSKTPEVKMSYVATTPKPRLVHLSVKPEGEDTFMSAGRPNKAVRFVIHVEIGGMTGVIAPLIGKEPPDIHVWVSIGEVPAFVKSEEPLYMGGPMLRTELVSPVWPGEAENRE